MTRPAPPPYRRRGLDAASIIAALVFNGSLLILPFASVSLLRSATASDLIDYAPTEASIRNTRGALAAEAARFAPAGGGDVRREAWNNLIAREMGEGDVAAARGFALNAPALLGGGDAARVRRQMRPGATDANVLEAVLPLIEPAYARQRFRSVIGRSDERGGFDVMGDARETADTAQRWLGGETVDLFQFTLGGATLTSAGVDPARDDVRLGASVIKIAKNNGRLSPQFSALIDQRLADAVPIDRLRGELTATFQNRDSIVDEGAAATLAFSRAIDHDAYAALTVDLAHIGAAARAASPAGAAILLSNVQSERDLRRLELLAVACGERAVAVAKRTPTGLALKSAHGAIRWSGQLAGDLMSVVFALVGMLISTHVAMMHALRREWESDAPRGGATTILSKAAAQRLAHEKAPPQSPNPPRADARVSPLFPEQR